MGIPFSGRMVHLLKDGVQHERDVVRMCMESGYKVYYSCFEKQLALKIPLTDSISISGHTDGILSCGTKTFDLDRHEPGFKYGSKYYLLEITAPNNTNFHRLLKEGSKSVLPTKYMQIQIYLKSEKVHQYSDNCILVCKNKNNTALYEEGIVYHPDLISELTERIKRVDECIIKRVIPEYRCADERQFQCKFRKLCFETTKSYANTDKGILDGTKLKEANELMGIAAIWQKGHDAEAEGKELVAEARSEFQRIISEYNADGLVINGVRAKMVSGGISRSCDYDLLKLKSPELYDAVIAETPKESYVRVTG